MKILCEYFLNEKKCQLVILNYEDLKRIKCHPLNRPNGQKLENDDAFIKSEIKKGNKNKNYFVSKFQDGAFDPSIKVFRIGINLENDIPLFMDGGTSRSAIIEINEGLISDGKNIMYNEFQAIITYYDNDIELLVAMEKANDNKQWTAIQKISVNDPSGNTISALKETMEMLGIEQSSAKFLLWGDLSGGSYDDKTLEDAREGWKERRETFFRLRNLLEEKGKGFLWKETKKSNCFGALDSLMRMIYNAPNKAEDVTNALYKNFHKMSKESIESWKTVAMNRIIGIYSEIDNSAFSPKDAKSYNKRHTFYRSVIGKELQKRLDKRDPLYKLVNGWICSKDFAMTQDEYKEFKKNLEQYLSMR